MAIDFLNDISHMKQTLPVYHASMKDSGDYQVIIFNPKCYTLKEIGNGIVIDFRFFKKILTHSWICVYKKVILKLDESFLFSLGSLLCQYPNLL